jgi:hypothetical protein
MPDITRDKLDLYGYLSMIILKFLSGLTCLGLLIFITVYFIYSPSIAAGIAEVTLGGTTFVMYRYFFDTRKAFLECPDCGYEGKVITDPLPSS